MTTQKSPAFRFETARLVVKPHTPANAEKVLQWENDAELLYLNDDESDTLEPATLEEIQDYVNQLSRRPVRDEIVYFAIHKKADDAFIGYGMIAFISRQHHRCELGVTIGERSEWGKGYAHEALVPVIDYIFEELGLNRISVEIYCFNQRSIKLFEKLGFKHEGTLRQSVWKRGQPIDDCRMALLREDWEERRRQTGP